jgi:hypothetical protein
LTRMTEFQAVMVIDIVVIIVGVFILWSLPHT